MALVGGEKLDPHNLRDFLRVKDDDRHSNLNQSTSSGGGSGRHNPPGLTLNAILSAKRSPAPPRAAADEPPLQRHESSRTLLDIIREDQSSGVGGDQRDGRRSWKQLREKICLRTRGGGVPVHTSDIPIRNSNYNTPATTRHHSTRLNSAESTQVTSSPVPEIERVSGRFEHDINEGGGDAVRGEEGGAAEQPVRMSLMALLAENDRQMGLEGSAYVAGEDKENVPAQEESVAGAGEYNNCCVCMLRHKGAAFIPCGHTFCRLCSRELLAQRGNCPLCNNNILEILDIF